MAASHACHIPIIAVLHISRFYAIVEYAEMYLVCCCLKCLTSCLVLLGGCWPPQHTVNASLVAAVDVMGARKWLALGNTNGGSDVVARLLRPGADSGADAAAAAVESSRREISAYICNTVANCTGLRGGAEVWMGCKVVIEIPKGAETAARLPHEATIVSQTAKAVRVTTAALQALWCAHLEAEERNQKSNGAAVIALLSVAMTVGALRWECHGG